MSRTVVTVQNLDAFVDRLAALMEDPNPLLYRRLEHIYVEHEIEFFFHTRTYISLQVYDRSAGRRKRVAITPEQNKRLMKALETWETNMAVYDQCRSLAQVQRVIDGFLSIPPHDLFGGSPCDSSEDIKIGGTD